MVRARCGQLMVLGCFFSLVPGSSASQTCSSASVPLATTNWNNTVVVPRFDSGLGILDSVTIQLASHVQGSARIESLDAFQLIATTTFSAHLTVFHPSGSVATDESPALVFQDSLQAFDGVIDFRGTSGVSHLGLSVDGAGSSGTTSDPGIVGFYAGPAGNPGTIGVPVQAIGVSTASGSGNLIAQFAQQSSAAITVCYNYTPRFSSFCAGDGSGTACPCGNTSPPDRGCLNSFGFGSMIAGSGAAIVGADTVVLTANVGATAPTTFFQGTAKSNNGLGVVFGDGLRCVGGSVIRLQTASASAGVALYPHAGDPPVSVRGMVPGGATRFYQAWYRQAAAFCTLATFNLSQGLQVVFGP